MEAQTNENSRNKSPRDRILMDPHYGFFTIRHTPG